MHAVFKWRWYGFLIAISVIGLLVRFWVIARFEFIADNGTEFYVMQQMKSGTCWPLVGPLIGVEHLYIPPTYFYILYSLQQLLSDPATIVYAFAVINILAILFLGLAISVATNRSTAVVVLLLAHCTYALFTEGTYIWHPQPVSIFFSFGLWMLLLAGKKQNILYVYTGLVSYFLALSIHPSSLPLLPFFVYHVVFFFRQRTSQWMNVLLHTFWLMVVSAIPIYATQILFEYLNGFPTIVTLFLRAPDTSQSAFVAAHFSIENIISILRYFVTRTIGLTHSITGSFWELIFWLLMVGMVTAVAITKHSWRWKSLFPYSLIVALGVLAVFHDHELLFWSANHRFMPMLLFLLFVFAELWFYLQKAIFTKVLLIIFALLFFIQNGLHFLDRMQALSHPDIAESFAYKKDILTDLESMLSLHAYQLNTTLLLRKNNVASSYGDAVNMQYYAMEYWAVSDFQSLTPPINFSCNQFEFLTADQIRQQAQQIILIESPLTAINSPPLLFNIYLQQAVWNIDQTTSFIVYERVACSL